MTQNIETQTETASTPMGHVWFVVLISMCFTLGAAWLWHMEGMSDQARHNKAIDDAVTLNTARIAVYRDVLKEQGKDAAVASLSASSFDNYGN